MGKQEESNEMERKDVGIIAMEIYFPSMFISQKDLEECDGCVGKYTIGLGQNKMAFCSEREDINSICLTVVRSLMSKYSISYKDIGRLEVGSESLIDKSKSVKSVLMSLFEESGNFDVEGVDTMNGCYGGTNALFNSINWIESQWWDGRYALVVAGDNAVYAEGIARATGGCGAVAMLIGVNAPLVFVTPRSTYMRHVYDFYKPTSSPYPIVDGKFSVDCYCDSLLHCFHSFSDKYKKMKGETFNLDKIDYVLFHSPYNKIIMKSFSRLYFKDLQNKDKENILTEEEKINLQRLQEFNRTPEDENDSIEFQRLLISVSKNEYEKKVMAGTSISKELGNLYTASLYTSLLSLITFLPDETLIGKKLLLYSYGSGLASTLYSIEIKSSLAQMKNILNINERLEQRKGVNSEEFHRHIAQQEEISSACNYTPQFDVKFLADNTYYLDCIDHLYRRKYLLK